MTDEEISSLWEAYGQSRSREMRNLLAEAYLPLARRLARRFSNRGIDDEDLFQVASLALIRAVEAFEPQKGNRFISYAIPCIEGSLRNELRDRGSLIRLPEKQREHRQAIAREIARFEQSFFRTPTPDEIAERLKLSAAEVLLLSGAQTVSLEASLTDEEDGSLSDFLGSADPAFEQAENRHWLAGLTERLPEQEKQLIELRYVRNLPQREVARCMGISQMQVSRLEKRLLMKLRALEKQ